MSQLTYQDQADLLGFEGGLYDSGPNDVVSRTPGGNVAQVYTISVTTVVEATAEVWTLTVDTAANADAFTLIIGGFEFTGTTAGTDAATQAAAIRTLLALNTDFTDIYTVGGTGADVTITGPDGETFAVYETVEATSAWSWAYTTPAVIGTHFYLTVDGHVVHYAAQGTVAETESDAFLALIQADDYVSALVTAAEGTGAAITLTAVTAGVPFVVSFSNRNLGGTPGTGTIAGSATTANVTGNPVPFGRALAEGSSDNVAALPSVTGFVFAGVSVNRAKSRPRDNSASIPVTGDATWKASESMPVLRKGRIWVIPEDAVTKNTSGVYVRFTQGASANQTVGRFRGSADSGKTDQITSGARWLTSASAGQLALLEINLP